MHFISYFRTYNIKQEQVTWIIKFLVYSLSQNYDDAPVGTVRCTVRSYAFYKELTSNRRPCNYRVEISFSLFDTSYCPRLQFVNCILLLFFTIKSYIYSVGVEFWFFQHTLQNVRILSYLIDIIFLILRIIFQYTQPIRYSDVQAIIIVKLIYNLFGSFCVRE